MIDADAQHRAWLDAHLSLLELGRVFIVGCPKSGTTWVQKLLDAHPEAVVRGEGRFAWALAPLLQQAARAFNADQTKTSQHPVTHISPETLTRSVRTIIDTQLLGYITQSDTPTGKVRIVGDKTPQHSVAIPTLAGLFPTARFIHIVRDPRDAAASAWKHLGRTDGRSKPDYLRHFIQEVWALQAGSAHRDGRSLGPDRYAEVRYEDLLANPIDEATRLADFLGLAADPATIAACLDAASFERASGGRKPGEEDPASFFRKGVAGDWVNHIDPAEAHDLCAPIAPLMATFGYATGDRRAA